MSGISPFLPKNGDKTRLIFSLILPKNEDKTRLILSSEPRENRDHYAHHVLHTQGGRV